jgi:aminopeptidase N
VRRILTVAAAVAALTMTGTAADAVPAPGSAGIGDSYFPDYGNGGYDVGHYDIRLRYFPDTDRLTGTTTILATATQDLSTFDLDFVLAVSSVRVNNRAAAFRREGDHELVVTPARAVAKGAALTVVVAYSDIPSQVVASGFTSWTRTGDGALAVNEPEIAWWWFPSNDHPLDKATFDVSVAVPNGLQVISNGRQPGSPVPEVAGWTRWSWRETRPEATYLAFLAIGKYDIVTDTAADGTPIVTAYSADLGELDGAARSSVERTNEIVEWESGLFGPYPFDAQGGVVTRSGALGFALEDQTRPVYDGVFFRRGSDTYVVVHENAHQWFGDSVAVADWRNIWLNEGFATYAEWLWSEQQGEGTVQELADTTYAAHPAGDRFWQVLPGDPTAAHLFNGAVYDRGALALHALRMAVGDDTFFATLRAWAAGQRDGTGTIEQFEALAGQLSGQNLSQLFTTWLFATGKPAAAPAPAGTRAAAATAVVGAGAHQPKSWAKIEQGHALLAH